MLLCIVVTSAIVYLGRPGSAKGDKLDPDDPVEPPVTYHDYESAFERFELEKNEKLLADYRLGLSDERVAKAEEEKIELERLAKVEAERVAKAEADRLAEEKANAIVASAESNVEPNRGNGERGRLLGTFNASAYTDDANSQGQWVGQTATEMSPQVGVVAVDPRIIPLHTKLYIEGYGNAVAGDTGGAIKGYKIDLFMNSREECRSFGRKNIKVWVMD